MSRRHMHTAPCWTTRLSQCRAPPMAGDRVKVTSAACNISTTGRKLRSFENPDLYKLITYIKQGKTCTKQTYHDYDVRLERRESWREGIFLKQTRRVWHEKWTCGRSAPSVALYSLDPVVLSSGSDVASTGLEAEHGDPNHGANQTTVAMYEVHSRGQDETGL